MSPADVRFPTASRRGWATNNCYGDVIVPVYCETLRSLSVRHCAARTANTPEARHSYKPCRGFHVVDSARPYQTPLSHNYLTYAPVRQHRSKCRPSFVTRSNGASLDERPSEVDPSSFYCCCNGRCHHRRLGFLCCRPYTGVMQRCTHASAVHVAWWQSA